jgi:hypothetical protein
MGKTNKPLTIVALPPTDGWDELGKLEAQGHTVIRLNKAEMESRAQGDFDDLQHIVDADLIIGANAWRMTTFHSKYLPVAIKEARMLRYTSKEEKQDVKNRKAADAEFGLDSGGVQQPDPADVELPPD